MRNGKKGIAPKIEETACEFMTEIFPSVNAGATVLLESFPDLYRHTLAEMRGVFDKEELVIIADAMNGHGHLLSYGGAPLGAYLLANVSDTIKLNGKIRIDPADLLEKLKSLSRWQVAVLELWTLGFWKQNVDFDEYVKSLTACA